MIENEETDMSKQNKGACMCRVVQFSFTDAPRFVADCVCEYCRKAHGATAVCWVGVKTEQFNLDTGKSALKWYQSSQDSERGFCVECGTRIFFRSSRWPGEIHLALACFDTPHDLVATKVSFEEELPVWTALTVR
jgi:hypothetical protein